MLHIRVSHCSLTKVLYLFSFSIFMSLKYKKFVGNFGYEIGMLSYECAGQLEAWQSTSTSIIDEPWPLFLDEVESYFTPNPNPNQWEQPNIFSFPCSNDVASCSKSNQSFSLNTAEYMASKGKAKMVWQKVRNAFKLLIHPHMSSRKN